MTCFVLSSNAKRSLQEIKSYSLERFGERVTLAYLEKLHGKMRHLAENPASGKSRDEIRPGYYSCFEGSHTIYYKIHADSIAIIDVLHQSMEPMRHLPE